MPSPSGRSTFKSDLLASLVVFMVALPLCIAIARACNLPVEAGIITGIVGGLIVGPLAGSPLQVSGPAAGLIVLVLDFVMLRTRMLESGESAFPILAALGMAVLLGGLLQLGMAAVQLGPWFRAVAPAVVLGMLGGIGVVIFAKQVHVMIDDKPADSVIENLRTIPMAAYKAFTDKDPDPPHHTAAVAAGLVTMLFLVGWKPFTPKRLHVVPAALIAVVAGTTVADLLELDIHFVEVESNLAKGITWVSWGSFSGLVRDGTVWKLAIAIALIASAETLLCATAVDQMHTGPRTNYNRELFAQGVGNTVCGTLGALPMTGVIVRSSANVSAGAKTRLSATLHGAWLLLFVALLPAVLEMIPSASLAAVLVYTGIKLVDYRSVLKLWHQSRTEVVIFAATLIGVVVTDLLTGVMIGVGLSAAKLVWITSHLKVKPEWHADRKEVHLHIAGAATFLSLPKLAAALEKVPAGWDAHVFLDDLSFIDHACLQLLTSWEKQHQASGGRMFLDQDGLRARFDQTASRREADGERLPEPSATPS